MNFAPCLVIPIYNHGAAIGATVARLRPHGLPMFIIDDGSDAPTRQVLEEMAQRESLIRLSRLPHNAGKGAAVMHGMREAYAAGFSHALQIDADGQHDTADVPRFLARAQAHPQAVICGAPIYDDSVPRSRLYGRYLTHVWVWIETLSPAIADSMCGFRLYPLAATCDLIDRVAIPTRMDFDIEIIVRLFWAGVAVENLRTRVTYPLDGVSHFDVWRDNLRISRMHTRLFFGMLGRLPWLLGRKIVGTSRQADRPEHWSRIAERGTGWGVRALTLCYRALGRRIAVAALYPVVAYFFITARQARVASRDYLARVAAARKEPAPGWRASFRHMLTFACAGLDKSIAWMGGIDPHAIEFPDRAAFDELVAARRGAVFIGAHLGNLEMIRALAVMNRTACINAVVFTDHARRFNANLARLNSEFGFNLLHVADFGPETAILLQEKIDRGEILVIVGDRTPPADNGRTTAADFLGAPALFPQGPFVLASLLACPVFLFFCVAVADGRYRILFEPFAERLSLPRRERDARIAGHVQRYADRLQALCLAFPLQWFNFFEFWRMPSGVTTPLAAPATPSAKQ